MRKLLLPLLLLGCEAPGDDGFFNKVDVRIAEDEIGAALEFLPVIEGAENTLRVALPHGSYLPLTDAIIAAHADGVDVRVCTDVDRSLEPGIQALLQAGVPTSLNDGAVGYFDFGLTADVLWSSEQVIMSHAFAVADRTQVVSSTMVGGTANAPQVVFQMVSEEIGEDLTTEHNQIFGGSDATALTAFSAPAKSRADVRDIYVTDTDAPIEVYFGPQDRLTKRLIDGIYSARSSIRILTNVLGNDGINQALREKSRWGFFTEAIVGPDFETQRLGREFLNLPDAVTKLQITGVDDVPTVVLIDIEGGIGTVPRAYVISHDLYSAERLFGRSEVITDQLIDGNLMLLHDIDYVRGEDPESSLQPLVDLYFDHQMRAGAL